MFPNLLAQLPQPQATAAAHPPPDGVWLTVLEDIAGDKRHEPALLSALEPHVAAGLAWLERDGEGAATHFGLTDPEGFLLSNDVVSDIFLALDES